MDDSKLPETPLIPLDSITDPVSSGVCASQPKDSLSEVDHAFLKEVHHRVKNNLQVVCSLLRLQGRGIPDQDVRNVFKRSEERIQSMALVYDKLYKSDGQDCVALDEYIKEVTIQLVNSVKKIEERPQLEYRSEPIFVSSRLATAVGLLVNEVISNHLRVYALGSDDPIVLSVGRDYRGVTIELNEPIRPVILSVSLSTLDQQILDALVKQINGTISLASGGAGSTAISFPIN